MIIDDDVNVVKYCVILCADCRRTSAHIYKYTRSIPDDYLLLQSIYMCCIIKRNLFDPKTKNLKFSVAFLS